MDNDKYIGRLLDNRYEIQEVIGIGGMAVVYKARCHRLNRLVAIKILKDEYSKDEEFRRRFHAEGQAVAMLSHPNIVSVYDVSTTDEADYIVMELIDGISLKQYMEKKGVLNWKETLHFAIQISKALEHAHSRGIVHRDIKPHTVMVLKNGSVNVADFGIARVMSKSNTLTKEALGSVHYISPEQAKGGRVDDRSDIYSLGVVMYEMMTGRPPYDGESPVAVAIQHINGGARMPSTLNPNIPGGLEQIIMKAMAHEPGARYASATAMLYDMDEFRKLPTILFDYNTPPIEAVTQLKSHAEPAPLPPKTTAERVAEPPRNRQQPVRRAPAAASAAKSAEARRRAQERRRREEYDDEDDRSKVATIAVVACSAVAIIAIVIFLVTLFNGGIGDGQQLVMVPTLVGKNYDTLQTYSDLVIVEPKYSHDETYEKGRVIEQNPKPGERVAKGTEITITVSLGPVPQAKFMEDLVGQKQKVAENYLDGQGILYLCKEEHNSDIEEGKVCRTEPEAGKPVKDGQTVTLYISLGSAIKKQNMPAVVDQNIKTALMILNMQELDLDIVQEEEESLEIAEGNVIRSEPEEGEELKTGDTVTLYVSTGPKKAMMPDVLGEDSKTAKKLLTVAGFIQVTIEEVDSDKPAGEVIEQSVKADEEIPINTAIVLKVAKGPIVVPITMVYDFSLPTDMINAYDLQILDEEGDIIYRGTMNADDTTVSVTLTGIGTMVYTLSINENERILTEQVTFPE